MKRGIIGVLGMALTATLPVVVPGVRAQEPDRPMAREPAVRSFGLLGGTGAYLGVSIQDVDAERAEDAGLDTEYGVYLADVAEDGPAAEAGLEAGDILVRWNGDRLESAAQLQRLVRETPVGRDVVLTAVRDGREREVTVELGDRGDAMGSLRVFTVPREREELRDRLREGLERGRGADVRLRLLGARPRLGVSVQSMSEQLADYFGVDGGLLVSSVSEDSPAEAAGIRAGDVIVEVAGESVEDAGDIWRILGDREPGPVDVVVVRDRDRRTLTVELEEGDVGWSGDGGVYLFGDEDGVGIGRSFRLAPIEVSPTPLAPIDVRIPRIVIPRIDLPAIEAPEIVIPRLRSGVRVIETSLQ